MSANEKTGSAAVAASTAEPEAGQQSPDGPARADPKASRAAPRARDGRVRDGNVGQALRSVYQQTVNEDVPDDLMQLLGKLS